MPVTVVPTSAATWAIDTFITELSSVMRNCAVASVNRTSPAAPPDFWVIGHRFPSAPRPPCPDDRP